MSSIAFKLTPQDAAGTLVLENTFQAKGGPPRHVHPDQDKWFNELDGEFAPEPWSGHGMTLADPPLRLE